MCKVLNHILFIRRNYIQKGNFKKITKKNYNQNPRDAGGVCLISFVHIYVGVPIYLGCPRLPDQTKADRILKFSINTRIMHI